MPATLVEPTPFTVELSDGRILQVARCPLTGDPLVDRRSLVSQHLRAFSQENPPGQLSGQRAGRTDQPRS